MTSPGFDHHAGWVRVEGLLAPAEAAALAAACDAALRDLDETGPGDKPHGGTRRMGQLLERVPAAGALTEHPLLLAPVHELFGREAILSEVAYRCPGPGYGAQKLHADDQPSSEIGPARCATAIVALVAFTSTNGATRVVPGSHRRPDLQRHSGNLDDHPDEILLTGDAGTAFVFSGHLLHSGTPNRSSAPRPAIQVTWRAVGPTA